MKLIQSPVLYVVIETNEPEGLLRRLTTYPHEAVGDSYFVQLYEGNLEERIALHVGNQDVPCPTEGYLPTLLAEYHGILADRRRLYQFVLEGYTFHDDFEDDREPGRPDYEEFEKPPTGDSGVSDGKPWLTIDEVVLDKDVDKSTVTRAIYNGEIRCGLVPGLRRRYVCPDGDYEAWTPSRKKSYLRDRRILIARDVLQWEDVFSVDDLFRRIEALEAERFGRAHLPSGGDSLGLFFQETLGEVPQVIWDWMLKIDGWIDAFGLDDEKKLKRGLIDSEDPFEFDGFEDDLGYF